jgi:hypothetical protein
VAALFDDATVVHDDDGEECHFSSEIRPICQLELGLLSIPDARHAR